jgi:hypothetical protein
MRLHRVVQEVYNNIPKVYMEAYAPLEEKVMKINKVIQVLYMKIVDLEAHTTPSTSPEEKDKREKTTMTTMDIIKSLDK